MRSEHFLVDLDTEKEINTIQEKYKITRRSDAIRFAIAIVANSPMLEIQPPAPKKAGKKPKETQS